MTSDYKKYCALAIVIFLIKILLITIHPFHHPSEIRYASISMRMALSDNYLMPFFTPTIPFLGKPPLSFWASAVSFKAFGFNEFAGRLPHLLAIFASCFLLFNFITKISDKRTAIIAVIILLSCPLIYAIDSVMTEAFLLLGMTMITTSFWLQMQSPKPKNFYGYLFFFGCVIATLTKGLVGIAMTGLPIFVYLIVSSRFREFFKKFPIILGSLIFIFLAVPWFILAEMKYPGFLEYFFIGENFDRFAKPGWTGDRYGNAHRVPIASIWLFFILTALPVFFIFFTKPKTLILEFYKRLKDKNNQTFLFFFISFLLPLIVLTFTRNMVMTYTIYALVPFVILMTLIFTENNWNKFISFLAYLTVIANLVAVILFVVQPQHLMQRLNCQDYLIRHIPKTELQKNDFELYYLGKKTRVFTLYWYAKDKVKLLDQNSFAEFSKAAIAEKKYVIGDLDEYLLLPKNYQAQLNQTLCSINYKNRNRTTCLFESNS
ncbi:MAG: glycosyltransferase family 39 protein [Rickettsiales bacterium]|nr:glycosyltransferase family 39 protein [Rickettsiales bacterium]